MNKQPQGFYPLSFIELGERFGNSTLIVLFILFVTQRLHIAESKAYLLFGTLYGLMYIATVIAGWLADNYLGFKKVLIMGMLLLFAGHLIISIPDIHTFYISLSLIVMGGALFKPCATSMLGSLYIKTWRNVNQDF